MVKIAFTQQGLFLRKIFLKVETTRRTINSLMMNYLYKTIFFSLLLASSLFSDCFEDLERDLTVASYWCHKKAERFPVTYNFFQQGGSFMMPSARMGEDGELALGFSNVYPYYNWNARAQVLPLLEISGSYRVFRGIDDPLLSPHGFGDFSDKGVNAKLALFLPEDSRYALPGLALGWDDFLGTKQFTSQYIVATQVVPSCGLEASLGWGRKRIRGVFGSVLWSPFWNCSSPFLQGLTLGAEYDAIAYHDDSVEPHPKGREQKWDVNFGLKYRLLDVFSFEMAYVRGQYVALGTSMSYNFGQTEGFLPKVDDRPPYTSPCNHEPINPYRPEEFFVQELYEAFSCQGLELVDVWMYYDSCFQKTLKIRFTNTKYRQVAVLQQHLLYLLAALTPLDIESIFVEQVVEGLVIQEWHFWGVYLRQFQEGCLGNYETMLLSPLQEVTATDSQMPSHVFHKDLPWVNYYVLPETHTYFGSSKGKFKYAVGLSLCLDGFTSIWNIYYQAKLSYLLFSYLDEASSVDMLNPSQLINVHTDIIDYEKQRGVLLKELFLQKNITLGKGFFSRVALGYFDEAYAGVASEWLWYPVTSCFAVGVEGDVLFKRTYNGLGFSNKVRKLHGFVPSYQKFVGTQAFLDLYYDWRAASLSAKLSLGKFLANDVGGRLEVARYFPSGLRIGIWYTVTNGNDKVNGHTYYDKGVAFSMPLDIFFTCSSQERFGYGMSAWLRDVGYRSPTGVGLYDTIYYERQ